MACRTQMAAAFIALTPILAGCGSSLSAPPTTPTSAQSPAPGPPVAGERWTLTATVKTITGPEACISDAARMTIGQSFSWLMTIERSGESIHLIVSEVDDPSGTPGVRRHCCCGRSPDGGYQAQHWKDIIV